jgi:hypothetical protein
VSSPRFAAASPLPAAPARRPKLPCGPMLRATVRLRHGGRSSLVGRCSVPRCGLCCCLGTIISRTVHEITVAIASRLQSRQPCSSRPTRTHSPRRRTHVPRQRSDLRWADSHTSRSVGVPPIEAPPCQHVESQMRPPDWAHSRSLRYVATKRVVLTARHEQTDGASALFVVPPLGGLRHRSRKCAPLDYLARSGVPRVPRVWHCSPHTAAGLLPSFPRREWGLARGGRGWLDVLTADLQPHRAHAGAYSRPIWRGTAPTLCPLPPRP